MRSAEADAVPSGSGSRQPGPYALRSALRLGLLGLLIAYVLFPGLARIAQTAAPDIYSLAAASTMLETGAGQRQSTSASGGYALLVWGIARITPGTRAGLACWSTPRKDCSRLPWIVAAQLLALAVILVLFWRLACDLSGQHDIALITVVLVCISARLGELAGSLRHYIWFALCVVLYLALLSACWRRRRLLSKAGGAGIALGAGALLEPTALLLVPVTMALVLYLRAGEEGDRPLGARLAACAFFLAGTVAALAGLVWAGKAVLFDPQLVQRTALGLVQRLALNSLDRQMWMAAVVTPVPLLGDIAAGLVKGNELRTMRLLVEPSPNFLTDILAQSGRSGTSPVYLLLRDHVLGHPLAYLGSMPPVLMRGLFAGGGIVALIGIFHVRGMWRFARAADRRGRHLLVFTPIAAMFVLNVLFSQNWYWLNPGLSFLYAYAIAYVASGW